MIVPVNNNDPFITRMRAIARAALFAGAAGSIALMFYASERTPILLIVLFIGWLLAPYLGFLMAELVAKSWSARIHLSLYWLMIVNTLGSLVGYSGVLTPPGAKPAFVFVMVPIISWLLIGIFISISWSISKKNQP